MEAYRIVKGNSVILHAVVRRMEMSRDLNRLTDFDMRLCETVEVALTCGWGEERKLEYQIAGKTGNEIIATIPGDLDYGRYGVRISWEQNGVPMASVERKLIGIVDHNSQTRLPLGHVETESAGLFTVGYWLETADAEVSTIVYALRHVTVSNNARTVLGGSSYETVITADDGYSVGEVKVVMNGEDVTPAVYDIKTRTITIPHCHGYISIMADSEDVSYWAGASAAKDTSELDIDTLQKMSDVDMLERTVSVTTTAEKPYVWMVSRVPMDFTQGGLLCNFHAQHLGDLWYFHSDPLTEGVNEYRAIKR